MYIIRNKYNIITLAHQSYYFDINITKLVGSVLLCHNCILLFYILKVESSMPRRPQKENLGQLSITFSNDTTVAQWVTPSCSRPQPDTDNGLRDGRFN